MNSQRGRVQQTAGAFHSPISTNWVKVAEHADRVIPIQNYTKGLLLPIERKSVEPMAARLAPGNVRQMHQSLHHIVAEAAWSDAAMLREVRRLVLQAMTRKHCLAGWIVDDTGFPKKGTHSVGVARQYCGQLGKQENCRVAVSLSLATEQASLPVTYRLYLPEPWAQDPARKKEDGPKKSTSRRRTKSRSLRSGLWSKKRYHRPRCWPMPPMATITAFALNWKN